MKEANIGIFICDCGDQISSFLDLDRVEERVRAFPGVRFTKRVRYACNGNGLRYIRDAVVEGGVEKILVAGCTARTMEPLFEEACQAAGLSGDRFELVDIREGCAWVHRSDPQAARLKAEDLIRMGVARLAFSSPCPEIRVKIEPAALVIGGGLVGMTAALCLADAKIPVKLVEREPALGGILQEAYTPYPEGGSASKYLSEKIEAVTSHPHIEVLLEKQISEITGSVGRYSVVVNGKASRDNGSLSFEVGAIVVATGARESEPRGLYRYDGKRIVTQLQFEQELRAAAVGPEMLPDKTVMILCAGQRDEHIPYCSNFCCMASLKQAVELKTFNPTAEVTILFRDFNLLDDELHENEFFRAAQAGVKFIRYTPSNPPEVSEGVVILRDEHTSVTTYILYDRIVLATPLVPQPDSGVLSHLLKLPRDKYGFFLDRRHRLRPEDRPPQGVFVCGAAHFPVDWGQAEFQATSTAFHVLDHLSKDVVVSNSNIVTVDDQLCSGCGSCVDVCSFGAISMRARVGFLDLSVVDPLLCVGCGNCVVACPVKAIQPTLDSDPQIYAQIEAALQSASGESVPRIVTFGCEWSSQIAADLAGARKLSLPVIVRPVKLGCSARLDPLHVLWAFLQGADGIFLGVCPPGKCHYGNGNEYARNRINLLYAQLEAGGFDRRRLRFEYIQPDDPDDFVEKLTRFSHFVCDSRPKRSLVQ